MPPDLPLLPDLIPRKSICLGQSLPPNVVIHEEDTNFSSEIGRLYPSSAESNVLEELAILKSKLRQCNTDDFWSLVSERMAEILGAQLCFIAKRILVDEQDTAVEMPPLGEPGSCLMATAWYYNDGHGLQGVEKGIKYAAYGCPCGYMRHDKVFVVPEKVGEIFANNPNKLPVSAEAYIGVPLFAQGKCIAHFGVLWSVEGAKQRKLSWAFIEMFMHSLEDIILERLLEGSKFSSTEPFTRDQPRVIPHEVITAAQSLQPYAKSLSHELRTPMQGVVGMLDVMYATVQEATEGQTSPEVRKIFETLKENIEIVQDSSRRAVEAADNVVHAYDMNMGIPASIPLPADDSLDSTSTELHASHPEILVAGSDLPISRPNKRRREEPKNDGEASPSKIQVTQASRASKASPTEGMKQGVQEAEELPEHLQTQTPKRPIMPASPRLSMALLQGERAIAPGVRHTNLRRVLQYVVNEGLKVGGRPESAIAQETPLGEIIEVCTRSAKGEPRTKLIQWSVEPSVPETMLVDEKDLAKLISCVFLNAIKFTDQGNITVQAKLSPKLRYIVVKCTDTGPGIPAAFLPRLFQPFSQEDPSLTRQSEGLGLGLLVAKGLARKLGGDLFCIRADTSGPNRGSEFEMRIPLRAGDATSRPSSSLGTPGRVRQSNSVDSDGRPSPTPSIPHVRNTSDSASKSQTSPTEPTRHFAPAVQSPQPIPPSTLQFPMPSLPARQPSFSARKSSASVTGIDRNLATKYPLTFLVAEDNKINRKLLVNMLTKFGYNTIIEAYDGAEAVRQMAKNPAVDVVLMDLWMPFMDGYEATEKILAMPHGKNGVCGRGPTVLAVTADVTDGALERAARVGMKGFMTKPFKLMDLQRLILEYCARSGSESIDGE